MTTNYLVNGQDLNTFFAPIAVNQIDYGVLCSTNDLFVPESWTQIINNTLNNISNNIVIAGGSNNRAFKITSPGFYRLNITLNFGKAVEETQNVVFILSNDSVFPSDNGYNFEPSPRMSKIYSINCSGANGYNGDVTNYLNNINAGNCLKLNATQNKFNTDPYFFSFVLEKSGAGEAESRSNFFTLDIMFEATEGQFIYPYIRCQQSSSNPSVTLQNSKWMFTKINDIPL
jgi:hypothetical protein